MFKEIDSTIENIQAGDRTHFFWHEFPDGNIINGGCNILKINKNIESPKKEYVQQEGWSDAQFCNFEILRKLNKLVEVTIQLDYYDPSIVIMNTDMSVKIYRKDIT